MNRKKLMNKIIMGVLAGGMVISTGYLAINPDVVKAASSAVMQKQQPKMERMAPNQNIKSELDKLVKAGTITQDEEDKIVNYMKQKDDERKSEMDKIKNMSESERQSYFANKSKEKPSLASELTNAGLVSQEKANAIVQALPQGHEGERGPKGEGKVPGDQLKTQLDKLVSSNTITQDQETKILDYMKQKDDERKTEMDKVKSMSESERQSYFENKSKEKPDFLSDLVKSGVISQDQANSIKKDMPSRPTGDKGNNKNN